MVISYLKEVVYVPILEDSVMRGTFDTTSPPYSSVCFTDRSDAENFIEFCQEKYPTSRYGIVEYKIDKPIQE